MVVVLVAKMVARVAARVVVGVVVVMAVKAVSMKCLIIGWAHARLLARMFERREWWISYVVPWIGP